jgi:hypothetical protein
LGVTSGTVVGTVVVAIGISLKLLPVYYNKAKRRVEAKIQGPILSKIQGPTHLRSDLDDRNSSRVAAKKQNLPVLALSSYNSPLRAPYLCRLWPTTNIGKASGFAQDQHRGDIMSIMWPLGIVCGVLLTVFIILLIYRSTLTMQEDDQLFLGESESHMEKEQIEIMAKVNKITPVVKWLGAASGVLILVMAGLLVYQGLQNASQ